jgi:hypothetical protein
MADSVDWRAKNKNIKSGDFILHTLGVTDTMLRIERNLHALDDLRLIDRDEIWLCSPNYSPNKQRPFDLPTKFKWSDGSIVRRHTKPGYRLPALAVVI